MASKGLRGVLNGNGVPLRYTGANQDSICRYNMLDTFSRPLLFERRERLIEASAWKVCPANYFALLGLRGKAIRTRKKYRN
jgi:hypothetical protein